MDISLETHRLPKRCLLQAGFHHLHRQRASWKLLLLYDERSHMQGNVLGHNLHHCMPAVTQCTMAI